MGAGRARAPRIARASLDRGKHTGTLLGHSTPLAGALNSWTAHSVVIDAGDDGVLNIPRSLVTGLDLSRGSRPRGPAALRSAGYGLLIGGGGGLLGCAMGSDANACPSYFCFDRESTVVILGVLLGGSGALLGRVGAALDPGELWERSPLPGQVHIAPRANGFALSASIDF